MKKYNPSTQSQGQPTTRVVFRNAKIIPSQHDSDDVVLEFPGIEQVVLDGVQDIQIVNPETGDKRKLNDEEIHDFENAIESFVTIRIARQLKKFIRWTEPGQRRDADTFPEEIAL
jgi:hypothetical protein